MVSLEQIKLLESKVSKTIDYVKTVTDENRQLKENLDSYQNRIDELEALVLQFKQDQSRIEDGILSALDRLNQFEDALESKLSTESKLSGENKPSGESKPAAESKSQGEPHTAEPAKTAQGKKNQGAAAMPEASTPSAVTPLPQAEQKNPEEAGGELDIF